MDQGTSFHMADVRRKRPTARRAVAVGEIYPGALGFEAIAARQLPKGDALVMAELAGLQGAKSASTLMPLCHPLPLEMIAVRCQVLRHRQLIRVYCEVAIEARTGVEMEALAGVNAALLTIYDLTKPIDPALSLGGIRLLFKEGGKKGLWLHPDGMSDEELSHYQPKRPSQLTGWTAAVLTLSDRAHAGTYPDGSGPLLVTGLNQLGADVKCTEVLPDDMETLVAKLMSLSAQGIGLVLTTGGTGLAPRDTTPEALAKVATRHVPGLAEMFRSECRHHTHLSWLSRADAVMVDRTLVIALPGSPRAAAEGLAVLGPLLAHARAMIEGEGHG